MASKQRRQIRKRRCSSNSEEDSDTETNFRQTLEDTLERQKLRGRAHGVTATALASGAKKQKEEEEELDPLKLKTGGCTDLKTIKRSELAGIEGVASFAAETNRRDEDADMLKYVESELARRRGTHRQESDPAATEQAGFHVPDYLKIGEDKQGSEDMLSNQMLSGIPEVDLGIEAKIKNIEKTEEAKAQLLEERRNRKEQVSQFVPSNMAVNYVQHNRWNNPNEKRATLVPHVTKEKKVEPTVKPQAPDDPAKQKATDDFHFEKFKRGTRHFRR